MRVKAENKNIVFELDTLFRSGGEGAIYEVPSHPDLMAKVYHTQRRTSERIAKLQIMVARQPGNPTEHLQHPSIAWPTDLLRDTATNQVVGFLMPSVQHMRLLGEVYNPKARLQQTPLFSYLHLLRTARNLCAAVNAVHQAGYVIGDLNESNAMVSDEALVTLVDTDTFQVRDPETGKMYDSLVSKVEYMPPELQCSPGALVGSLPEHDAFALAVLVFRLLMEGFHPFDAVYHGEDEPPCISERIRQGYFPYAYRSERIKPPPIAPPFEMLHCEIRNLFMRCFKNGHCEPRVRPSAKEWLHVLEHAENDLQQCSWNEQHYYWKHFSGCPWCARRQMLGGLDPFPSRQMVESGQHLDASHVEPQQPLNLAIYVSETLSRSSAWLREKTEFNQILDQIVNTPEYRRVTAEKKSDLSRPQRVSGAQSPEPQLKKRFITNRSCKLPVNLTDEDWETIERFSKGWPVMGYYPLQSGKHAG